MPVKIDTNFGHMTHPCFDCDVLSELKEIGDDIVSDICLSSPCEDIWKKFDDFLLTPPQSPPIKFDLVSDFVDFSSIESLGFNDNTSLHNADVLHDCMWSGQCVEDITSNISHNSSCSSSAIKCNRNHNRPDTPFNALSSSPLTMSFTLNDLLTTCDTSSNDDMDDSQSSLDDEEMSGSPDSITSSSSTSFAKVKESLINDHSYGGSIVISQHKHKNSNKSNYETQSLIHPKHKVQTRAGNNKKCHKLNGSKIKIIKANSPMSSSKVDQKDNDTAVVPTVRIIRNDKHFTKSSKISINTKETQIKEKHCKFSTRRKGSSVSSERSVMLAQNQFIPNDDQLSANEDDEDDEDSTGSPDKSKVVPPLRRREHNDSERKRRDHLRNAFLNLKDQIPKLKSAEKRPPRIMILHEATAYVCHLNDKQRYLERTRNAEIEKRDRLLKILNEVKPDQSK